MDWSRTISTVAMNIVRRIPVERLLFPPQDNAKDLEKFLATLQAPESQNKPSSEQKATVITEAVEKVPQKSPPVPRLHQIQKTSAGTGCRPCTADHLSTCAGALSEALRFVRSEGMESNEVQERLALCAEELNIWERRDAAPKSFVDLPDEDKAFLRRWLPKGRWLRHQVNTIQTMEGLEKVAADAQRLHLEARKDLRALGHGEPTQKSPLSQRFEAEMGEHFEEV